MVRLRFAPSPTGYLHLGNVRTAVFNFLYARKHNGKFILRIEDTDIQRSEEKYVDGIKRDLEWLGLHWDEMYFQSHRFEIYREYAQKLIEIGRAYYCTCTREEIEERQKNNPNAKFGIKYDRKCRGNTKKPEGKNYVIRFDIGDFENVEYEDLVKEKVKVPFSDLDDLVIIKGDGTPTYNFAVVIDDHLMGITHVIRGDDHITNTAKQIRIYEALNFTIPKFAHLPLILNKNKSPLSKREGSITIEHYRKEGYIPMGIINYLVRLGWSYHDQEIFTMDELLKYFDVKDINKSNAIFDDEKMLWVNAQQIKMASPENILKNYKIFLKENNLQETLSDNFIKEAFEVYKTRINTLKDFYQELRVYATENIDIDLSLLPEDGIPQNLKESLKEFLSKVEEITNSPKEEAENILRSIPEKYQLKLKDFGPILRVILTGRKVSPGLIEVIKLLGPEKIKKRVIPFIS